MKKKNAIRLLEAAAFCILLFAAVMTTAKVVERKASISHLKPFFDHAQEYDVLYVGDSLVINGIFPMEMWEDYGIAGYNLASYGNTIPVTYWTLMNALDYACPKTVVIGIKDVEKSYKLSGSSSDLHTAFDGYPLSLNKIRAIEDLTDDPDAVDDNGIRYADMKWEYYFTLGKYHARWSELSQNDFRPEMNKHKGANMLVGVEEDAEDYEIIEEWDAAEESGWGFVYLRRMIDACRSRGIDVLLVHLPYPASANAQRNANTVIGIAEEYDIDYIDFVNLDQAVDYETDCYDPRNHLNASGAKKVSDYLARYLVDHYGLPDRRNDASYAHWHEDYDQYIDSKRALIQREKQLDDLLMLLHDRNFSAVIAADRHTRIYEDEKAVLLMHNAAREHVFEQDAFSKWSNALFPLEKLDEAAWEGDAYLLVLDRLSGRTVEWKEGDEPGDESFSFGRLAYHAPEGKVSAVLSGGGQERWRIDSSEETSVHIVVIDDRTGEPVQFFHF